MIFPYNFDNQMEIEAEINYLREFNLNFQRMHSHSYKVLLNSNK